MFSDYPRTPYDHFYLDLRLGGLHLNLTLLGDLSQWGRERLYSFNTDAFIFKIPSISGHLSKLGRKCSGLLPDGRDDPDRAVGQPQSRLVPGTGGLPLLQKGTGPAAAP